MLADRRDIPPPERPSRTTANLTDRDGRSEADELARVRRERDELQLRLSELTVQFQTLFNELHAAQAELAGRRAELDRAAASIDWEHILNSGVHSDGNSDG